MPKSDAQAPGAITRADALLTRWERKLTPTGAWSPATPADRPRRDPPAVQRAEAMLDRAGQRVRGRGLLRPVARGYVWLAATVQAVASPIQQSWQESLDEARHEQEQQVARRDGTGAAHREEGQEKRGEGTLKKTAGATAEAATDAAGG